MTDERKLRVRITTGEISPEDCERILTAVGSVIARDTLKIDTLKIKPPKEKPTYPEIPQEMLGRLGSMSFEELLTIVESQGRDEVLARRLWNRLAYVGVINRHDEELDDTADLDMLAKDLLSGELKSVPNVGPKSIEAYHSIIQLRIGQLLAEE